MKILKIEEGVSSPLTRETSSWGSVEELSSSGVVPSLTAAASAEMETGEEPHPGGSASRASEDTRSLGEGNSLESSGERPDQCLREYLRLLSADYVCECQLCDNGTLDTKELQNILAKRDTYTCDLCPYQTSYSGNLMRHIRMHIGENSYKCDECEYRTHSRDNLKRHNVTHSRAQNTIALTKKSSRVKYNTCDVCIKKHAAGKFLSCEICSFRSVHKLSLNKHKLQHLKEKKNNQRTVHGDKKFVSNMCTFRNFFVPSNKR